MNFDDAYRARAQHNARRFNEPYDRVKDQEHWSVNELYDVAYHYIEVGLIACLDYALPQNLPVVIYP